MDGYELTSYGEALLTRGPYRDRALLDAAYEFPCQLQLPGCEGTAGEPAHSNQAKHGKGGAQKAHDCFHVPACRACHRELDQGRTMTREQKFEAWDAAFWRYLPLLFKAGILEAKS
jgi:hypothetical protein